MASVNFITGDPEADAYDKSQTQATKMGAIDQQLGVDTAVRQGVNNMLDQSSQPAPSYQMPAAAPPPQTPQPTPAQPVSSVGTQVASLESGGAPSNVVNAGGYSGKYQLGKAALVDAGIYQPAPHEDLAAQQPGQWWGTFNVPGQGSMTYQQWLNNPGAQDASWQAHQTNLEGEIQKRGLDKYIGQTVGGVPVTQSGLIAMMQIGGPQGTQQFLQTGGAYNPADKNGTTIADYGKRVAGGAPVQAPPSPGPAPDASSVQPAMGGSAFMPGMNTSRYDPILRSLAATPGGGQAALTLLQNQGKFDQQNYRRTDVYQRLAMQAMAHGDPVTAKYYANIGGLQIPEQVFSSQNNMALMGRGSLVAQRVYGSDPQQAQRFLQTFMSNGGDVTGAFTAAGAPRSNPGYKLEWVQQIDGSYKAMNYGTHTGTLQPLNGPDGQQVTQAPKPNAANQGLDYKVNMLVGTGMPYNDAVQAVTGVGVKPATVANAYRGFYSSYANSMQGMNADEPTRQAAVEQQMQQVFGPGWRAQTQGQQAAPSPGVAVPATPQALPPAQTEGGAPPAAARPAYQPPAAAPPPTPQPGTATPQAGATPGQGGPMAAPTPQDQQAAIAYARQAINSGRPRQAVLQRLQSLGIPIPPDL